MDTYRCCLRQTCNILYDRWFSQSGRDLLDIGSSFLVKESRSSLKEEMIDGSWFIDTVRVHPKLSPLFPCPSHSNNDDVSITGGEGCIQSAAASAIGIGSDIGGSIRIPAVFNGVFGHKATTGLCVCVCNHDTGLCVYLSMLSACLCVMCACIHVCLCVSVCLSFFITYANFAPCTISRIHFLAGWHTV